MLRDDLAYNSGHATPSRKTGSQVQLWEPTYVI